MCRCANRRQVRLSSPPSCTIAGQHRPVAASSVHLGVVLACDRVCKLRELSLCAHLGAASFHTLVAAALDSNASQPGQYSVVTQPLDLEPPASGLAGIASSGLQRTHAAVTVEPVQTSTHGTGVDFVALSTLLADEAKASKDAIRVSLSANSERSVPAGVCVPVRLHYERASGSDDQVRATHCWQRGWPHCRPCARACTEAHVLQDA